MRFIKIIIFVFIGFIIGYTSRSLIKKVNAPAKVNEIIKPLEKYSIENLSKAKFNDGRIILKDRLDSSKDFLSYSFEFYFNPDPSSDNIKRTTGIINIPTNPKLDDGNKQYPLIIMVRGYVDPENYKSGTGTKNAAGFFAKNGYITIAPDFLGYAGSDKEAENIFESRFQTYTLMISLINTLEDLHSNSDNLKAPDGILPQAAYNPKLFIWAHSNGGQIALTTLEITSKDIPSALWAPVSKPFPYSILYFTDESDDGGKFLRKNLSDFESLYNTDMYSIDRYIDQIKSPLEICQGTADREVPYWWSEDFVKKAKDKKIDIRLLTFDGADHNMQPKWQDAVNANLEFFGKYLRN